MALICFVCFICFSFKNKPKILVTLLITLILLAPIQTILYLPITKSKSVEARSSYIEDVQAVQDDVGENSKIWIRKTGT